MRALIFVISTLVITFFILMPLLSIICAASLALIRRRTKSWVGFGSNTVIALILTPTLLPLVWLSSAALHESEPAYIIRHSFNIYPTSNVVAACCLNALLILSGVVVGIISYLCIRYLLAAPPQHQHLPKDHPSLQRLQRIQNSSKLLKNIDFRVVKDAAAPIYTRGIFRHQIVIDHQFLDQCDDQELYAALLHEQAHIQHRDLLYTFIAQELLQLNPLKRLLIPDFQRWKGAREAVCDGVAVSNGGDPLALAAGLVHAAKFSLKAPKTEVLSSTSLHLCGHDHQNLKLRINILMDGPETPPNCRDHCLLGGLFIAVCLFPHIGNAFILEFLHQNSEQIIRFFQL